MAKQNIKDLPTLEDMTVGSSLLDTIQQAEEKTPVEEVKEEEPTEEKPVEKPTAKKKKEEKKEEEPKQELEEEEEELTEEEEKEIFEQIKDKDTSKLNEAEKEIFDKYKKEEDEEVGSFWEDVEAITGNVVEVDYKDTDPTTPEGAALREAALIEKAQEEQLQYLQDSYPEAFAILQHYANGGSIQDLINPGETDYSVMTIKEDNVEQQKRFLTDYYITTKKLSDAKAKRMVEMDEESDEGLYKTAQGILEELKETQKVQKERKLEEQRIVAQEQQAKDLAFSKAIKDITGTGQLGDFKIPAKEIEAFDKVVFSRLQKDSNGDYVYVVPVNNNTITQLLQEAYFGYKKGDLTSLIKRQASTQNVERLKRKAIAEQKKTLKSTISRKPNQKLLTFDELTG